MFALSSANATLFEPRGVQKPRLAEQSGRIRGNFAIAKTKTYSLQNLRQPNQQHGMVLFPMRRISLQPVPNRRGRNEQHCTGRSDIQRHRLAHLETRRIAKGYCIMKTKLALLLVFAALTVSAQTNSIHTWTLKTGAIISGDYISSGTQMVVIKDSGTNFFLKITDLTTNDWLYFQECKAAQRQHQLDTEAAQMRAAGLVEFTSDLIENFPEKVNGHDGWMDGTFMRLDSDAAGYMMDGSKLSDLRLGFDVEDKNRNSFRNAFVPKQILGPNYLAGDYNDQRPNELVSVVTSLKEGDQIRLIGHVLATTDFREFEIQKIKMIESAVDAAAVKKVKENMETSR
jgi:hypothetical protein